MNAKVNELNVEYKSMRESGQSQVSSLLSLVAKNPYRLLSKKVIFDTVIKKKHKTNLSL